MTNQTDPDNEDTIVTATMVETGARDETDGHDDDDQRWAEAVITSLPSRSREARQALAEALLNGDAALPAPLGCAITAITAMIRSEPVGPSWLSLPDAVARRVFAGRRRRA